MSRMCSSGKLNQLIPTNLLRPFFLLSFIMIHLTTYDESLRFLLVMYAPVLTRDIYVRPLVVWFNEDIRNVRCLRRQAEKTWRATRLSC